jgi:molybdate-binding protein/DNA-binding transcriptional regulator YhcF (GntR family)
MTFSLRLDHHKTEPLYEQIVAGVRAQLARGELRAGDSLPTIRGLARTLRVNPNTVDRAYRHLQIQGLVDARGRQGTHIAMRAWSTEMAAAREIELRTLVSALIGEGVARGFKLAEVEAAFVMQRARWQERLAAAEGTGGTLPLDRVIGMGSQDLCLEILVSHFRQRYPDQSLYYAPVGSLAGLMALAAGEAHFAAAHIYDSPTRDYNLPTVRRLLPGRALTLVTLAHRTQGLLVRRGNPKRLKALRDLTRRGIRFVNRRPGSGTRVLLDELLRRARIATQLIKGYEREEPTHIAVASAVADGTADAGLGIEAAARSFELAFVPLATERYELVLPTNGQLLPRFLELIARPEFSQAVESLGGYDLRESGHLRQASA